MSSPEGSVSAVASTASQCASSSDDDNLPLLASGGLARGGLGGPGGQPSGPPHPGHPVYVPYMLADKGYLINWDEGGICYSTQQGRLAEARRQTELIKRTWKDMHDGVKWTVIPNMSVDDNDNDNDDEDHA